jgi:hypothetical protein
MPDNRPAPPAPQGTNRPATASKGGQPRGSQRQAAASRASSRGAPRTTQAKARKRSQVHQKRGRKIPRQQPQQSPTERPLLDSSQSRIRTSPRIRPQRMKSVTRPTEIDVNAWSDHWDKAIRDEDRQIIRSDVTNRITGCSWSSESNWGPIAMLLRVGNSNIDHEPSISPVSAPSVCIPPDSRAAFQFPVTQFRWIFIPARSRESPA